MESKIIETHDTCTSTDLDSTLGSAPEKINSEVLDLLHEKQTNTPISSNPVVARIQREQALMRDKRSKKQAAHN